MTRKFPATILSTVPAALSAVLLAGSAFAQAAAPPAQPTPPPAQPAPPPPQPAPPVAAAPAPTPPPGPGAAPSQDAPPSEQAAPAQGTETQTPVQAAASVETGTQVTVPAAPAPGDDNDLVPAGEKEMFKSRPVDGAGIEFKPGRGLTVKSADGDFELTTRVRGQFLYTINDSQPSATAERSAQHTLEIRRFRVTMQGNAFGVHNKFYLELGFGPREDVLPLGPGGTVIANTSTTPLVDAYAEFDYLRDLTLRVGQYKPSYGRQRVMSDGNLQFVDVSRPTAEFTFDRDVGLDIRSKDLFGANALRYVLGAYTGDGKNDFTATKFKMLYLARLEVLPLGLYEDYQEADFERSKPRLAIGVTGAHFTEARRDRGSLGGLPADGGTTDLNHFEADAQFKVAGLSLQTEIFWRKGDRNRGPAVDAMGAPVALAASRDGIGWYGQAGYLIPGAPLEISARYGLIKGKKEAEHNGLADLNEVGGAVSYYFARHPLKLQGDFFHVWNKDNDVLRQNVFRLQLQTSI